MVLILCTLVTFWEIKVMWTGWKGHGNLFLLALEFRHGWEGVTLCVCEVPVAKLWPSVSLSVGAHE